MREYHVRICEGFGVKFPGSTRQRATYRHVVTMSDMPLAKNCGERDDDQSDNAQAKSDSEE